MKTMILAGLLGLSLPVAAWQTTQPLSAEATPRLIELRKGVDAGQQARLLELERWTLEQTGERRWISTRMNDAQWQGIQSRCKGNCVMDSCQQVRTLAFPPSETGWLVPAAPDLNRALSGQASECPVDLQTQPWQGQLPAGAPPHCWQLQLGDRCQQQQTPAEYLEPESHPDRLLVLLSAAGGAPDLLAQSMGMSLQSSVLLQSTGDRLLTLERTDKGTPLTSLASRLTGEPGVSLVQQEFAYFTLAEKATEKPDPLTRFNYGPTLSRAQKLLPDWNGKGITVAVIDTGVDHMHPDLNGRLTGRDDFTGKGFSADAHGTAVAAIIGASLNNGIGAAGVSPQVNLHSYKACHPHQPDGLKARCWSSSLIQALDAAVVEKHPVINMSLGGPPSPILHRLVKEAQRRGLLVVSAAGNGGPNARPVYPAAWPEALAVTAVGRNMSLYQQANQGRYIQLAAPGVDIITAGPKSAQPVLSGTSMASAHLSGLAAQLKQMAPEAGADRLTALLLLGAEDLGAPGPDAQFGSGLVNACRTALGLRDDLAGCKGER